MAVIIVVIIYQLLLGEAQLLALHTLCVHIPIDPFVIPKSSLLFLGFPRKFFRNFSQLFAFQSINQSIKTDFYSAMCCKRIRGKFLYFLKINSTTRWGSVMDGPRTQIENVYKQQDDTVMVPGP